tara:strand:+ start:38 stop:973 length:936 start_codon:yes stop_codon:yes gene_type:complete
LTNKLNFQKKLVLIAGPTASGKSHLAIHLAKRIKGEIINADSMQVYKQFSVLTSRPSSSDLLKVKHHLYGFLSVNKYFSTGEWLSLAKDKINKCVKKKRVPILVGGTGLYFNAITRGISKIPQIDSNLRNSLRSLHKRIGQKRFYKKLIEIDPLSKKIISETDTQRTLRAYEVKKSTKKSIFAWAFNTRSEFLDFEIKKIFINIPKEELLKNISKRTELMFRNKCTDEVKNFLKLKIDNTLSANKIIGVREISNYLDGIQGKTETIDLIKIRTRQYAKRQNTWSRGHMTTWKKLYSKDFSILFKKVLKETT